MNPELLEQQKKLEMQEYTNLCAQLGDISVKISTLEGMKAALEKQLEGINTKLVISLHTKEEWLVRLKKKRATL